MSQLLSVIVPVYNKEVYLENCIESILAQTYDNLEIILVDDGSTDASVEICDTYAANHDNIRVIHCENGGITKARLTGVELARGEKVTFVDADDWVEKEYYQEACVGNEDMDIILVGIKSGNEETGYNKRKSYLREGVYERTQIEAEFIPGMLWDPEIDGWKIAPSVCNKIFKKEGMLDELRKAEPLRCNYGEDALVTYPLIIRAEKIKVLDAAYYNYRLRTGNEIAGYIKDEKFFYKLIKVYTYLNTRFEQCGHSSVMRKQVDNYFISSTYLKKKQYGLSSKPEHHFDILFPYQEIKKDAKVALYGAGKVGQGYIEQNKQYKFCDIVLWIDKNYEEIGNEEIVSPEKLLECQYDYVLIAIDKETTALSVKSWLEGMAVPAEKIVWHSVRRKTIKDV